MNVAPRPESWPLTLPPALRLVPPLSPFSIRILLPRIVASVKPFPLTLLDRHLLSRLWMDSATGAPIVGVTVGFLAEGCGVSARSIRRSLARLEGYRLIERDYQVTARGPDVAPMNAPTRYLLHVPASVGLDDLLPETRMNPPRTDVSAKQDKDPEKRPAPYQSPPKTPGPDTTRAAFAFKTQEDKTVKRIKTDTSETLFREDPRDGTGKSPGIPDPGARVAAATARLADPDHWVRKLTRAKSAGAVLAAYWVDKRTVAEPDVQPPRADGRIIGQAGHIVARFLVPGVTEQAAFDKARRIIDCAFARECWPFRGETSPVELSSLAHRAVFDRLRAHLGERINGPPPVLTQEERNARVRAEIDAENERNGFGRRAG